MILFTFIYEEDPRNGHNNRIEIDEDLFKRIGNDDMTALDDLYKITERTMYAFCLSLTKDHQKALDLMQDTYVKIVNAAHLYKPMGKPLAWIFTIAKNLHYTNIKKESRNLFLEPEEVSNDKRFSYVTDAGERIAKDIDYKGRDIYDVTEEILDKMMDENYLHKDHEFLLLSVYNKNQNKAEEQKQSLDKKIHDHLQAKDLQPIVLLQKLDKTSTIEDYAKKYGISVSKMNFIRNLIILNPDLETEDLVDLSIEQLVDLSQGMGLELEKIIESTDFDRILTPSTELDLEPEPDPIPVF